MKKVAILLCLSSLTMLLLAFGGKIANHGHLSAKNPDELPVYLLTLGNLQAPPSCTANTQSSLSNDNAQMPLGQIQSVLKMTLQYYEDQFKISK